MRERLNNIKVKFNNFYGWYMVRYSNGKSTPLVTHVVDGISVGSFLTPMLLLQEGIWFRAFISSLTIVVVGVLSLIVVGVGHIKIRLGTAQTEMMAGDMIRPMQRETWENTVKIRKMLEEDE